MALKESWRTILLFRNFEAREVFTGRSRWQRGAGMQTVMQGTVANFAWPSYGRPIWPGLFDTIQHRVAVLPQQAVHRMDPTTGLFLLPLCPTLWQHSPRAPNVFVMTSNAQIPSITPLTAWQEGLLPSDITKLAKNYQAHTATIALLLGTVWTSPRKTEVEWLSIPMPFFANRKLSNN